MERLYKLTESDNVAVATMELVKGDVEKDGENTITILSEIPQGFKVALVDIHEGEDVIKYGIPIGHATKDIQKGELVHTFNMTTNLSEKEDAGDFPFKTQNIENDHDIPLINAYLRRDGKIGIRNSIWILPLSQNLNVLSKELEAWGSRELGIEDKVHAFLHAHAQSQFGEDEKFILMLTNMITHPDHGGVLLAALEVDRDVISQILGKIPDYLGERVRVLYADSIADEFEEGKKLLRELAECMKGDKRTSVSISKLVIGLKCGQSDALSSITANRLIGKAADYFSAQGSSLILTEVPEMLGSSKNLVMRAKDDSVREKVIELTKRYRKFLDREGKKKGEASPLLKLEGISTEEEESMGAVQKAGQSMITDVLEFGEVVKMPGISLLASSGTDAETSTALTISGVNMILFSTGIGTPYGAPVPTIKIASNRELSEKKPNWIDFDSSRITREDPDEVLADLIRLIVSVSNGEKRTRNEENGNMEIAYNMHANPGKTDQE